MRAATDPRNLPGVAIRWLTDADRQGGWSRSTADRFSGHAEEAVDCRRQAQDFRGVGWHSILRVSEAEVVLLQLEAELTLPLPEFPQASRTAAARGGGAWQR